jgi:hypothetical protein
VARGLSWRRSTLVALVALVGAAGVVPASSATNPSALHPASNIAARPNFENSGPCYSRGAHSLSCQNPCFRLAGGTVHVLPYDNSATCTNYVLAAINAAHAVEHLAPMVLPNNWYSLTVDEQMFVLTDLERTVRGLTPYLGLTRGLAVSARAGALKNVDPWFVSGVTSSRFTSILADASPSPLAADYVWMYDDGWAGSVAATSNIDCTSAQSPRCWGHRANILGNYLGAYCHDCQMGAAYVNSRGAGAYAEIFVRPQGRPAAMYFTWSDVLTHLSPVTTTTSGPTTSTTSVQITTGSRTN